MRLKGWSETKINRWLENKEIYFEKNRKSETAYHQNVLERTGEVDRYIRFITTYLTTDPYAGLVLHWNSRGNSLEDIASRSRILTPVKELVPEVLLSMQTNIIYQFE